MVSSSMEFTKMENLKPLLAVPLGAAFGTLVRSSGVYAPEVIRAQMIFHKNIMMKMFMGGLFGSSLAMIVLSKYDKETFDQIRETKGFGDKGAISAIVGGLIQGVGMTLSGACPGMIYAQLGAGSESAHLVMIGGLFGATAYSLLQPTLKRYHEHDFTYTLQDKLESMHLEQVFTKGSYTAAALMLAATALSVGLGFEHFFPTPEIEGYNMNPVLAGSLIGTLQIPLFAFVGSFLGMSSGYSVLSAQVLRILPDNCLGQCTTHMQGFVKNKAAWQVMFGLGVALGSFLLNGMAPKPHTVDTTQALVGGFLLVFGARFVGGCASGHGLTGLPSLHVLSWLVVPSMFGGAILTGNIMTYLLGKAQYLLQ